MTDDNSEQALERLGVEIKLLKQIDLLERKLELCKEQRDYYIRIEWGGSSVVDWTKFVDEKNKELEDLK